MQRIQRKRAKGYKMPENTISCARPGKWGNPLKVVPGDQYPGFGKIYVHGWMHNAWYDTGLYGDVTDIIHMFRLMTKGTSFMNVKLQVWSDYFSKLDYSELKGKNLACFCKEGAACHCDVLLEIANK